MFVGLLHLTGFILSQLINSSVEFMECILSCVPEYCHFCSFMFIIHLRILYRGNLVIMYYPTWIFLGNFSLFILIENIHLFMLGIRILVDDYLPSELEICQYILSLPCLCLFGSWHVSLTALYLYFYNSIMSHEILI